MPESAVPAPDLLAADDLLQTVLAVSAAGIMLLRPLYEAGSPPICDFAYVRLNPAAQRTLGLPEQPTQTLLEYYPPAEATSVFAFLREAFLAGEGRSYAVAYASAGLAVAYHLRAQRSGEALVVSVGDAADHQRSGGALGRRAHEARAEVRQLQALVDQAPVAIGFFEGPDLRIGAANHLLSALWGRTQAQVLNRPLLEAVPELQNQGFEELLHQVRETGVPFVGTEVPAQLLRNGTIQTTYYNFVYQPLLDAQGAVLGVVDVAMEVTEQVLARQQVQALHDELLAVNRDLQAATAALEQARAEAELQRRQLHNVLEQAPAMICIFEGPQHTFQFVNPPYQALVGERPLVGKPIAQAMPELAGQPVFDLLDQVYRTGETFFANEMMVQLDHDNAGTAELGERCYNFIYQARHDLNGAIDGILVFAYDVSAQVRARQQVQRLNSTLEERVVARTQDLTEALRETEHQRELLRQQESQLQQILGQAPAAIATLSGPEHRFTFFNARYQALAGGRAAPGHPVAEALPEVARQGLTDLLDQVYATGKPAVGTEVPMLFLNPTLGQTELHYLDYIYQPLLDAKGQPQSILAFSVDTTEKVLAHQHMGASERQVQLLNEELAVINEELAATNEELAATNEELQVSNEKLGNSNQQLMRINGDLDNFIYSASHDLKQPISNIEGLLAALAAELPAASQVGDVPAILTLMQQSVDRFKRTIDNLTDITKLQKAHDQPATNVALAPLIEAVRLDLLPQLAATGGRVEVEVSSCPTLAFSEKNLRSIVYNLVSNAIKYHAPDRQPLVRLRCFTAGAHSVLEVADNGLGFAPGQQGKLFGLFQRLHDHVEGSGVGLYMVKKIMDNAGGYIDVDSQPGVGSVFRLYFAR